MAVTFDQGEARYDGHCNGNPERGQYSNAFQRVRLQPSDGEIDHVTRFCNKRDKLHHMT